MRVILCGYNWTGCKALQLLMDRGYEVYVYTHETQNCCADLEGMCIKQSIPYSLQKIHRENLPFQPDVICSIYYRFLISEPVIDYVQKRIFNLHPSLLPEYRGCSSLTWALINGDDSCGFTYHYIDRGCDTGAIILQRPIPIEPFDTQATLYNRVMFESMLYFYDALDLVVNGYPGTAQKGSGSYHKRGCPLDGVIRSDYSMEQAERIIRAMINPPYKPATYKHSQVQTFKEFLSLKS